MMPRLIYANTKNSDMLYATKTNVPDAFLFLEFAENKFVFLDKRDLAAFKEHTTDKKLKIASVEPFIRKNAPPNAGALVLSIIRKHATGHSQFEVPTHFPLDISEFLRSKGIVLKVKNPFFSNRLIKRAAEINTIEECLKKTGMAFKRIEEILKLSSIKRSRIIFNGSILTSEFIKREMDLVLLEEDMINTEGIIVSSGRQAAIPHHTGSGPLSPHQPIICDIFPKNRSTGYFGDITRTYVKGHASKQMRKIYRAVLKAQKAGIAAIKPGVTGRKIHETCCKSFLKDGYEIGPKGFIHNTGHGLGLDIHEPPYLSKINNEPLMPGNIVTVEPGLYYKDKGSARIEDVILVTKTGHRNLTNYPKFLEIS